MRKTMLSLFGLEKQTSYLAPNHTTNIFVDKNLHMWEMSNFPLLACVCCGDENVTTCVQFMLFYRQYLLFCCNSQTFVWRKIEPEIVGKHDKYLVVGKNWFRTGTAAPQSRRAKPRCLATATITETATGTCSVAPTTAAQTTLQVLGKLWQLWWEYLIIRLLGLLLLETLLIRQWLLCFWDGPSTKSLKMLSIMIRGAIKTSEEHSVPRVRHLFLFLDTVRIQWHSPCRVQGIL